MTSSVFYSKFDRHAHGEGLKGHATHYCPGCGHGLAHKYLAEAIEDLDIQDRTVAISPVGCAVFLYYYMDVGNTQAAHGRAPAVALGQKLAHPESIVISYQGDGDLASIGLAEIFHAAQLGVPITVFFVNNAIYGMTGGQLAPTTLMGQVTSTTPEGRTPMSGQPLRMAELIAQLDGPVYVERVALFNNQQRMRTKKAFKKALRLQLENKGFSFVEVLAECPTHLKMTPEEAEAWVKDSMVPVFPLGVKKDVDVEPRNALVPPSFDVQRMLGEIKASNEVTPRFCKSFPSHLDTDDIPIKLAGSGGDGAQTVALLLTHAAINEGFDATHIPSYGPESRGGTSYADVHIARDQVLSPAVPHPRALIAFNAPSLAKFGPMVQPAGLILYDSSVIHKEPSLSADVKVFSAPFSEIAGELGMPLIKNIVALGAFNRLTRLFERDTLIAVIQNAMRDKCAMIPLNIEAFSRGEQWVESQLD